MKPKSIYTVWVGGIEVTDEYLTEAEANKLVTKYEDEGYDDVRIEQICQDDGELVEEL